MGLWNNLENIYYKSCDGLEDFTNYIQGQNSRAIERYGEKLSEKELRSAINHADGNAKKILGKIYKRKFR